MAEAGLLEAALEELDRGIGSWNIGESHGEGSGGACWTAGVRWS
jgi:hypothetical protein